MSFVKLNCRQLLNSGKFSILRTTFDIFDMLLHEAIEENPEEYDRYLRGYFEAALIYSLCWGIGGILETSDKENFDVFLREVIFVTILLLYIAHHMKYKVNFN